MKKKIIITAIVTVVIVGGVFALYKYSDYTNYHWADNMLEQSEQLLKQTSGNDEFSEILAISDTAERKARLRVYADENGIKIKELSDRALNKYKEKSEKSQEDIDYISLQIEKIGRDDPDMEKLLKKWRKLTSKKLEYDVLIAYNES